MGPICFKEGNIRKEIKLYRHLVSYTISEDSWSKHILVGSFICFTNLLISYNMTFKFNLNRSFVKHFLFK